MGLIDDAQARLRAEAERVTPPDRTVAILAEAEARGNELGGDFAARAQTAGLATVPVFDSTVEVDVTGTQTMWDSKPHYREGAQRVLRQHSVGQAWELRSDERTRVRGGRYGDASILIGLDGCMVRVRKLLVFENFPTRLQGIRRYELTTTFGHPLHVDADGWSTCMDCVHLRHHSYNEQCTKVDLASLMATALAGAP